MSVDDRPQGAVDARDPVDAQDPVDVCEVRVTAAEVVARPGSDGEHRLQERHGTTTRATTFYANQVREHLLPTMVEFVQQMDMVFVATTGAGRCHSTVHTGAPGFLHVLGPARLALPDRRHRQVAADVDDNAHVGLLMVDFEAARIGLHVNGAARVLDDAAARAEAPSLPGHPTPGTDAVWVLVEVEEAYIHCRKHIPTMATLHRGG